MLVGAKNHYSYGFYGVSKDFYIYELLSGVVVDRFISQKGMSEREEILHNIFNAEKSFDFKEILSAHKGLYYLFFISKRDKYLIRLAQKAIKRMREIA
ncbi:hypothetical protein LS74_009790 [Helicobacter magdeburgensis]|uniref:Uncharacterized protein n=1 Tax=Helicobacter magdeburgensis TaxID=471858 RepID=A0A4U8SWE6_9HELI|nr:hypothetical protein [Helicobacter magdeburgensis]TLD91206.1 hypothetical protein LS74_009790 [Helicobacter magdeburgensis]